MRVDVVRLSHSGTPRPPAGLPTLLLACLQTLETKGGEPRPGEARAEPLGGRAARQGQGLGLIHSVAAQTLHSEGRMGVVAGVRGGDAWGRMDGEPMKTPT